MSVVPHIEKLLEEKFQDAEFQDVFIVEIKHHSTNNKLEVFLDADSVLTIEQCARLNRYLQKHLDENGWIGEEYILDVSSPGVGKPLRLQRQYSKNIGRTVEITLTDKTTETGILKKVNDLHLVVEKTIQTKEGKKKKTEVVEVEITWNAIQETVVKIVF